MTLIIGHRDGWMVADRRCTSSGHIMPERTKVHRYGGLLIGLAGISGGSNWLKAELGDERDPVAIRKGLWKVIREWDKGSDSVVALVLEPEPRRLYYVDSYGGSHEAEWMCMGSGDDYASGWIDGTGKTLTAGLARKAVAYAATRHVTVGGKSDTFWLRGAKRA